MNYYEHHLGDWAKKCGHLTAVEEGIYRRLLDWYYGNERPLPEPTREVYRLARAHTPHERAAVLRILAEFFSLMDDGWHQGRADRELAKYEKRIPASSELKRNTALRQRRSRVRRQRMFEALREVGETPAFNATNYELMEMLKDRGLPIPNGLDVTRDITVTSQHGATAVQPPDTNRHPSHHICDVTHIADSERMGTAVRAIRKAGFAAANANDPRLIALLENGCTDDELRLVTAEAVAKGKGWAWLLATVKGRREDAARALAQGPGLPQEAPKTARQRAAEATVRDWLPQLAAKP